MCVSQDNPTAAQYELESKTKDACWMPGLNTPICGMLLALTPSSFVISLCCSVYFVATQDVLVEKELNEVLLCVPPELNHIIGEYAHGGSRRRLVEIESVKGRVFLSLVPPVLICESIHVFIWFCVLFAVFGVRSR